MMKIEIEPFDNTKLVYYIVINTSDVRTPRGVTEFAMSFIIEAENEVEALDKVYIDMMLALKAFFGERGIRAPAVAQDPFQYEFDKIDETIDRQFNAMFGSNKDFSVLGDK